MKRFLRSKLVLSLAAIVMIAAAIAIPLSGNYIRAHAQAPSPIPFHSQFTSADCSSPVVVATFNKGATVSGTVNYVNVGDSTENQQHEDLVLKETSGSFSQTI